MTHVSLMPSPFGVNTFGIRILSYTFTNTSSVLVPHPMFDTTCKIYLVSTDGLTEGCKDCVFNILAVGVQLYEISLPLIEPFRVMDLPGRVFLSGPALATGFLITETFTLAVSVQP